MKPLITVSPWQIVFLSSVANGANYDGDKMPVQGWRWPTDTFLQTRLEKIRKEGRDDEAE